MEEAAELNRKKFSAEERLTSSMSSVPPISLRLSPLPGLTNKLFQERFLRFFRLCRLVPSRPWRIWMWSQLSILLSDSSNWPGDEAGGYVELHCGTVFGDKLWPSFPHGAFCHKPAQSHVQPENGRWKTSKLKQWIYRCGETRFFFIHYWSNRAFAGSFQNRRRIGRPLQLPAMGLDRGRQRWSAFTTITHNLLGICGRRTALLRRWVEE